MSLSCESIDQERIMSAGDFVVTFWVPWPCWLGMWPGETCFSHTQGSKDPCG